MLFIIFPFLTISVILYTLFFLFVGGADLPVFLGRNFEFTLFSGEAWKLTIGDALLAFSLVMLFIELLKSTTATANSIANHALSTVLLVTSIIVFLNVPGFGTSVFFLIMCMNALDIIAGFSISIATSKRDIGVTEPLVGPR